MNIGIVGLGLIGGSIGLKLQKLNHSVYGVTNNKTNAKKAKDRKLANIVSCNFSILQECSVVILALPIKDLVNPSKDLIAAIPKTAIVTDVGSVKVPIVKTWEKINPLFIGSHPMAGTEKNGVEAGYENLFDNATWVITPNSKSDKDSLEKLSKLISALGSEIIHTSPELHDQAVALISHLPIFLSSCLIRTACTNDNQSLLDLSYKLAATGFADTSRVGGGNPILGLDLAKNNQDNIIYSLKLLKNNISKIEETIKNKDWESLLNYLEYTKTKRSYFIN